MPTVVLEFLKRTLPYSELDEDTLSDICKRCILRFYPKGTVIFRKDIHEVAYIHVIQTGGVKLSLTDDEKTVTLKDYSGPGQSFGATSIVNGRKAEFDVEAVEDTFCILIDRETFLDLVKRRRGFADYYDDSLSEDILFAVYSELRIETVSARSEEVHYLFNTRVIDVVKGPPEIFDVSSTVREVGAGMARLKVGSVLIKDANGAAVGMVTNRDLRSKVVAGGLDYNSTVDRIMTTPLRTVPALAFCYEALISMMQEYTDHLAVTHGSDIIGVISAADMMVFLGSSPLYLFREISAQRSMAALHDLAHKIPVLVRHLLENGARAGNIAQMITVFSDRLLERILTLIQKDLGNFPARFCWLGLGSEGRREQTFRTDQDNALIFEEPVEATHSDEVASYIAEFTAQAAENLERAGYPRCRNNFMASNPRWAQPMPVWKKYFQEWINTPMPPDIYLAPIFFDFRAVHGDASLSQSLRRHVTDVALERPLFLKHFARYFLLNEPPVSFFEDRVVEKDGAQTNTLDLKTRGLTPFVDYARILALRHGIEETNTIERLRALTDRGIISEETFSDASQAYEFDLHLTLVHQLILTEGGYRPDTIVRPADLSDLERKTLRFSFGVIERLVEHIREEFGVKPLSEAPRIIAKPGEKKPDEEDTAREPKG